MVDKKQKLVEVTRSFSYKLNLGGYQTADFFCSQKAEVSKDEAEKTSEALYEFCKSEVVKSVNQYIKENPPKPKPLTFKEQATKSQHEQTKAEEVGEEEPEETEADEITTTREEE